MKQIAETLPPRPRAPATPTDSDSPCRERAFRQAISSSAVSGPSRRQRRRGIRKGLARLADVVAIIVLIALAIARHAAAEPPDGADPALAPWYHSLRQPRTGYTCCSIADCRPVETRVRAGRIEAYIGAQFTQPAMDWLPVPNAVIIRDKPNLTGQPNACWFAGQIRCFIDAAGT